MKAYAKCSCGDGNILTLDELNNWNDIWYWLKCSKLLELELVMVICWNFFVQCFVCFGLLMAPNL
jgi:hypothetical protein